MARPAFLETYEVDPDPAREDESDFTTNCAAFWNGEAWHCPEAGSERCDLDCPHNV